MKEEPEYRKKDSRGNSSEFHTGKICVEEGCTKPAGTWWSPYWCVDHNIERMDRISGQFNDLAKLYGIKLKEVIMKIIKIFKAYAVTESNHKFTFQCAVDDLVRHGWRLLGGVCVSNGVYYQALRKTTFRLFYKEN